MTRLGLLWLLGFGAVLGCSHAAHVRDGVGCVDNSETVVFAVPPDHEAGPSWWLIRLDTPLTPGQAIRISRMARAAEYREGAGAPTFLSTHIDGILKRDTDQEGAERYALEAVATHPAIDVHGVVKRGVKGLFNVERRTQCR